MDARRDQALELMAQFAERTGLNADRPPQRYLWTDAFAVCTFLGLGRATGESSHTELALQLVDQVHHVLGRHRADDRRAGWISGLDHAQGEAHPTSGGLRIGKPLPERQFDELMDERLEWERDGQYFHYLTKWMHALDQVTRTTGQPLFNSQASGIPTIVPTSPLGIGFSIVRGSARVRPYYRRPVYAHALASNLDVPRREWEDHPCAPLS